MHDGVSDPFRKPNLALIFLLGLIILISVGLHAFFEAPAREWLRGFWKTDNRNVSLAPKSLPTAAALGPAPVLLALWCSYATRPRTVSALMSRLITA